MILGGIQSVEESKVRTETKAQAPAEPQKAKPEIAKPVKTEKSPPNPEPTREKVAVKPTPAPTPTKVTKTPVKQPHPKAPVTDDYAALMKRYSGVSTDAGGQGSGAGALNPTAKGTGGGELRSAEHLRYEELLRQTLYGNWSWPMARRDLVARVQFTLYPDGNVQDITIVTSSGVREFDDSVLRAVKRSIPVPPPPASIAKDYKRPIILFKPE
jgi:colicin import membrane protein